MYYRDEIPNLQCLIKGYDLPTPSPLCTSSVYSADEVLGFPRKSAKTMTRGVRVPVPGRTKARLRSRVRGLWIRRPCHDTSQIAFVASYGRSRRTVLKGGLLQFNQPLAAFLRITHPFFGCTHITSVPHPEHPRDPLGSHQRLRRNPCGQHLFSG